MALEQLGDLVSAFHLDYRDGLRSLGLIERQAKQTERALDHTFDEIGDDAERASRRTAKSATTMRTALGKLGKMARSAIVPITAIVATAATAVGVLALAFKKVSGAVIQTGGSFEEYEMRLKTFLGSTEKAKETLARLIEVSNKTPYALGEIIDAFVSMTAQGIDADRVLMTLGDTAAATGKSLQQVAEAFIDAAVGEFERLKELGVKARVAGDKITFAYADASGKMKQISTENNRDMIQSTLESIWNERYAGAMDEFQTSWKGMVSNVGTMWTLFVKDIGDAGSFDELKATLATLSASFRQLKDDGTLTTWASAISTALSAVAIAMQGLIMMPTLVKIAWIEAKVAVAESVVSIQESVIELGKTLETILLLATATTGKTSPFLPFLIDGVVELNTALTELEGNLEVNRQGLAELQGESTRTTVDLLNLVKGVDDLITRTDDATEAQGKLEDALGDAGDKADEERLKLLKLYNVMSSQQAEQAMRKIAEDAGELLRSGVSAREVFEKLIPKAEKLRDKFAGVADVNVPKMFDDMVSAAKLGPALFDNWATSVGVKIPRSADSAADAMGKLGTAVSEAAKTDEISVLEKALGSVTANLQRMPEEAAATAARTQKELERLARDAGGALKGGFGGGIKEGIAEGEEALTTLISNIEGKEVVLKVRLDSEALQRQVRDILDGRVPDTSGELP